MSFQLTETIVLEIICARIRKM